MSRARFDFDPIQRHVGIPESRELADWFGVSRACVLQWRYRGLSAVQADRLAVSCGMHPGEVWPEWWDEAGKLSCPGVTMSGSYSEESA